MNIVVCVKQVPDTETVIKIGSDGKSIVTDDVKWIMNPYDEFAVEEAVRLKEKFGGNVTVVGFGPSRVQESIRAALAIGADKGILISDGGMDGTDGLGRATILASVIKDLEFDLIFTGQRGIDEDMGLVSIALAELLGIPHVALAMKVEVAEDAKSLKIHREVEGQMLVIESDLPVLVTAQKGLNEPRYASLPGIMKAKKKPLEDKSIAGIGLDPADFGLNGSKLRILEITPPPTRKAGRIIGGETAQEQAAELARLLREEAKVI